MPGSPVFASVVGIRSRNAISQCAHRRPGRHGDFLCDTDSIPSSHDGAGSGARRRELPLDGLIDAAVREQVDAENPASGLDLYARRTRLKNDPDAFDRSKPRYVRPSKATATPAKALAPVAPQTPAPAPFEASFTFPYSPEFVARTMAAAPPPTPDAVPDDNDFLSEDEARDLAYGDAEGDLRWSHT